MLYYYTVSNYYNPMAIMSKPVWCVAMISHTLSWILCALYRRSINVSLYCVQTCESDIFLCQIHIAATVSSILASGVSALLTLSLFDAKSVSNFFIRVLFALRFYKREPDYATSMLTLYFNSLLEHSQPRERSCHRLDSK